MSLRFVIYLLVLIVNILIGLVRFKKLTRPVKVLAFLLIATFLSESISRILVYRIQNSMPTNHIFAVIEYCGYAYIFSVLIANPFITKLIRYSIFPVVILAIGNTLFFQDIYHFPSNILLLTHGLFLLFSLLLFKQIFEGSFEQNLFYQTEFWYASALLIFSSVVYLSFGLRNYFMLMGASTNLLDSFIYIINMIFYSLTALILILDREKSHQKLN